MKTTRRQTLGLIGGGALAASTVLRPRAASAATRITVLNWQGYGTDEKWALKDFKKQTGIEVVHDYFSSEPEMLTKLRTNHGIYDVVLINSARDKQAVDDGLIIPMDVSKIPNFKDLTPELKDHANLVHDGKTWGCAWVWGMNALAIREGMERPDSYAALWDPKYKGRVALLDSPVTEVGVGALATGQDMNNPKDLDKVKEVLKKIKPNLKMLWSSEDQWNKSFVAKDFDLSVYWSGSAVRSKVNSNIPVEFVVPKEGAIGWLDSLSIPSTSTNQDAAYKFINYMIDPEFYYTWATTVGAPASANAAAMDKLPEDSLTRQVHKQEYIKTMSVMSALPDDRRQAFNNLWQEMKAFYAS